MLWAGCVCKTLAAPYYWAIDVANSYPTIFFDASAEFGLDIPIPSFEKHMAP